MRDYGRPQLQLPIFAAIGLCCGSRGEFWVVPVSEVRALQGVREWGPESVLGEGVWGRRTLGAGEGGGG